MTNTTKREFRIDTELLISLIGQNRCIGDTSHEEYKNRDLKQKAFEHVASVVVPNYEDLSQEEKQSAVSIVQKRWGTARDAYRRDRNKMKNTKSGQTAKKNKIYVFYENLKFLEQVMELNATETSYGDDAINDTPTGDTRDISDSEIVHASHPENISIPSSTQTCSGGNSSKRKREKNDDIDDRLLAYLEKSTSAQEQADDRAFFESLLPMVKTFDEAKKLQFRTEVMRIVMEFKNIPPQNSFTTNFANTNDSTRYRTSSNSSYSRPGSVLTYVATPSPASGSDAAHRQPTLLELTETYIDHYYPY